jgi:D-alanine-D-alanine ligase
MKYDPQKPRVLVALGGRSTERQISIESGKNVALALEEKGYPVAALDTGTGRFLQIPELESIEKDPDKLPAVVDLPLIDTKRHFSLVFIALHGRFGEDGGLQALLDDIRIPYTGSGPLSSALAMNKKYSKIIFKAEGIPTPEYQVLKSLSLPEIKFPLVVKPVDQGSSFGVAICENKADFELAAKNAFKLSNEIIVEPYLGKKEITVAVIEKENGEPRAMPVIEIIPKENFFNFEAKYSDETKREVPAKIPEHQAKEAQDLAIKAHQALGCRHFSRVDMMIDKNGKIFVLELNTIPGLTSHSLLPLAAKAHGVDFATLVEHLIKIAIK